MTKNQWQNEGTIANG